MNWNDLRYFLAVARQGSLSAAAREMRSNPSTIARRIEALESALRSKLFERRIDGYELTAAGAVIVAQVERIAASVADIESTIGGEDSRVAGTVRVVAAETLAHLLILPALPGLQRQHPDLSFRLSIIASLARLPQREVDVGLRLCRPEGGSYAVKRVGTIGFGLYGSKDYLANCPTGSNRLPLDGHRLVTWGDPFSYLGLPAALERWSTGTSGLLTVDSMHTLLQAVRSGSGLGILPCIVANKKEDLTRIRPIECHHEEDIWLIAHQDARHTRRVSVVWNFLEEIVRSRQLVLNPGLRPEPTANHSS